MSAQIEGDISESQLLLLLVKKAHSLRIVEDSNCTSQDRPTSKTGKHKTELEKMVDSPELSDVTKVMIYRDK